MESVFENKSLYIKDGYSLIHFITIYLLARASAINKDKILKINKQWWVLGYFVCATIVCFLHFTPYKHTWAYSNPIVVVESFMFFFPFLYKQFTNKFINRVAASTLAVYVIQVTNPVMNLLFAMDQHTLESYDYSIYIALMFVFSALFFILCVVYYQITHRIFNFLLCPLEHYINEKIKKYGYE